MGRGRKAGFGQQPVTEDRKRTYLASLREVPNHALAARVASPASKSGARATWRDLRKRDPEFAAACEDAMAESLGKLEAVVYDRALHGTVTERRTLPDGSVLERFAFDVKREQLMLARHDPEYRQHRYVENNTTIDAKASVGFDPKVLEGLDKAGRDALRLVLEQTQRIQAGGTVIEIEAQTAPEPQKLVDAEHEHRKP